MNKTASTENATQLLLPFNVSRWERRKVALRKHLKKMLPSEKGKEQEHYSMQEW